MKNQGILVIVHQGYSFCVDLHATISSLELETYIVSSKPTRSDAPLSKVKDRTQWVLVSDGETLSQADIDEALTQLQQAGKKVMGAIATMEGYRLFAAGVNEKVGGNDTKVENLRIALDKLRCRNTLYDKRLSKVLCELLSEENFAGYQRQNARKFLKPRRGAAGFGVLRLKPDLEWARIEELVTQMKGDKLIECVFYGNYDYLIEDYIDGQEFSFEVIAFEGKVYLIASHEKGNEIHASTILEIFHWSPPVIDGFDSMSAKCYLEAVFQALDLSYGCFHVEMKLDKGSWEVIEINPRVGGSLINENVKAVADQSMLDLWVRVIAVQSSPEREKLAAELQRLDEPNRLPTQQYGAVFRQYFADPDGGEVEKIIDNCQKHGVHKVNIYAKEGMVLPKLARETILAEALWKVPMSSYRSALEEVKNFSKDTVNIIYKSRHLL